jgi:hypothetical protein
MLPLEGLLRLLWWDWDSRLCISFTFISVVKRGVEICLRVSWRIYSLSIYWYQACGMYCMPHPPKLDSSSGDRFWGSYRQQSLSLHMPSLWPLK